MKKDVTDALQRIGQLIEQFMEIMRGMKFPNGQPVAKVTFEPETGEPAFTFEGLTPSILNVIKPYVEGVKEGGKAFILKGGQENLKNILQVLMAVPIVSV